VKQGSVPLRSTLQPMRGKSQDTKLEDLVPFPHKIHHWSVLAEEERPSHAATGSPSGDSQGLHRLQAGAGSAGAGVLIQVLDPPSRGVRQVRGSEGLRAGVAARLMCGSEPQCCSQNPVVLSV